MSEERTTPGDAASAATIGRSTRALLLCGVAAGPLFAVVATAQVLTREGFDRWPCWRRRRSLPTGRRERGETTDRQPGTGYYLVRPVYRSLLRPIGLDVYIASSRSPVITDWVPNAPPDAQPTLFNDSRY
jgi:hypothetical protein